MCIRDSFYGATWAREDYLFYIRVDEAWRPHQIWRHKVGTPASDDVLVYEEADEKFGVGIAADRSESYLLILSSSSLTTEYRVLPMSDPEGDFEVLWPRESGVEYHVDYAAVAGEEYWIVTHNAGGVNSGVGVTSISNRAPLRELTELIAVSYTHLRAHETS